MRRIHAKAITLYLSAIIIFLIVRSFIVPPTFGEFTDDYTYRWFRGDSVREIMQLEVRFSTKEVCADCHRERYDFLQNGAHRTLSCETCHGPSMEHVKDPKLVHPSIDTTRELCKLCHEYNPTRPADFPQKYTDEHGYGRACVECHDPHSPWVFKGGVQE